MTLRIIVKSVEDLSEALKLCSGGVPLSAVVFGYNEPSLVECLAWELPKMHSDFVEHLVKDTVFVGDAAMTQFLSENVCVVVNSPQVSSILLGGIVRAGNSYPCGAPDGVTEDWEDEVFEAWLSVLGERLGLVEPSDVKYPPDALFPREGDVGPLPTPLPTPGQVVAQTLTPTPTPV